MVRFACICGLALLGKAAPDRSHITFVIVGGVVALTAGCGGSSVPEGRPIAVRFDVVERPGPSAVPGVRIAQPLTVHEIDAEWARVSRLLPDPLPEPVDQGSNCLSGHLVSVRLANRDGFAGEVNYGALPLAGGGRTGQAAHAHAHCK
jgi:hypothetical protein